MHSSKMLRPMLKLMFLCQDCECHLFERENGFYFRFRFRFVKMTSKMILNLFDDHFVIRIICFGFPISNLAASIRFLRPFLGKTFVCISSICHTSLDRLKFVWCAVLQRAFGSHQILANVTF